MPLQSKKDKLLKELTAAEDEEFKDSVNQWLEISKGKQKPKEEEKGK